MSHGIETTIVEIDPLVHEYATKYFGLPTNHKAVIEDAVSYAASIAQTEEKYDYIVNDVFTGGAEPVDLFTFEFLSDLRTILKPGGVIAIVSQLILNFQCLLILITPELCRRSPPPISTHNRANNKNCLPYLSHIPGISRPLRRANLPRGTRLHQHGYLLHQRS
jgi:Spermine/spermidine synthase domain